MDLRQKLARLSNGLANVAREAAPQLEQDSMLELVSHALDAETDSRAHRIAQLRALIGGVAAREQRRSARGEGAHDQDRDRRHMPWPAIETAHGPLHVIERDLEPGYHHGKVPVSSALSPRAGSVAALTLDPSLAELDLSRMLLLDTETTGLAGGTGTVPFLVGMARFEDGALRIEQLLLPNLGAETPMLARVAERLREASCIITYNGKAFDWPLLRTRFVLCRMPAPPLPPHIDLLHATRRIWKARLGSVRLTEIEREILRFEREGDIDGSEIPARYFEFLREGVAQRLLPIIEHNQNDLIALAAMLGRLAGHFESGDAGEHAQDALAFGKLCARAKDQARALGFANAALGLSFANAGLGASVTSAVSCAALELTSDVQRRAGDAAAAARALEDALGFVRDDQEAARLHCALAKLYEHGLRDALRAHGHARHTELHEGALAQGKRLGRLWRRILIADARETARTEGTRS